MVRTNVVALPASAQRSDVQPFISDSSRPRRAQRLYPVVDAAQHLVGLVTRSQIEGWLHESAADGSVSDIARSTIVVAYPDEPLRAVVHRMADTGLTRFPVVARDAERTLVGMISLADLLEARRQNLDAERRRERVLSLRLAFPRRSAAGTPERAA